METKNVQQIWQTDMISKIVKNGLQTATGIFLLWRDLINLSAHSNSTLTSQSSIKALCHKELRGLQPDWERLKYFVLRRCKTTRTAVSHCRSTKFILFIYLFVSLCIYLFGIDSAELHRVLQLLQLLFFFFFFFFISFCYMVANLLAFYLLFWFCPDTL